MYLSHKLGEGLGAEGESSEASLKKREEVDKDFSSKSCLDGGQGTLVPKTVMGDAARTLESLAGSSSPHRLPARATRPVPSGPFPGQTSCRSVFHGGNAFSPQAPGSGGRAPEGRGTPRPAPTKRAQDAGHRRTGGASPRVEGASRSESQERKEEGGNTEWVGSGRPASKPRTWNLEPRTPDVLPGGF